jgi:hypothetical protein
MIPTAPEPQRESDSCLARVDPDTDRGGSREMWSEVPPENGRRKRVLAQIDESTLLRCLEYPLTDDGTRF